MPCKTASDLRLAVALHADERQAHATALVLVTCDAASTPILLPLESKFNGRGAHIPVPDQSTCHMMVHLHVHDVYSAAQHPAWTRKPDISLISSVSALWFQTTSTSGKWSPDHD